MPSKISVKNPFLNALTYDFCYNMPADKVKELPFKYRRMLATETRTKNFCERATMDERITFFMAAGISFGISFFIDKVSNGVSLKKVLKDYESERLSAAQSGQAKMGVYVTTDKEVAFLMGMMSSTLNNETYLKTLQFNKTAFNVKGWSQDLDTDAQRKLLGVASNAGFIAKLFLNNILTLNASKELFHLNPIELSILLAYYQRRHIHFPIKYLYEIFEGYIQQARVTRGNAKLILNGYLEKHIDWRKPQAIITAKGINVVNDYMSTVLKQNEF